MADIKRVTIIVLDSLGVGQLPDAAEYGDAGADTLGHILDNCELNIPNLRRLGFGNVEGAAGGRLAVEQPEGAFGRFAEKSRKRHHNRSLGNRRHYDRYPVPHL